MKKTIVFTALILLTLNIYAQEKDTATARKMSVYAGPEWNMNSRENFAGGAVIGFDYGFLDLLAVGVNFTASTNFSDITVLEPSALFRWYFLPLGKGSYAGFFAQVDLGAYLVLEDGGTTALFDGGTGLGLAILKKIIELMHGGIHLKSEEGKGTIFTFNFRAEIPSTVSESIVTENTLISEEPPDFSGKQILLAEDIEINREIIINVLEPYGIKIIEAEDGKDAYDLFCANPESFDLTFMDIQMPKVDGFESSKLIRAHESKFEKIAKKSCRKRIPIIAMTANVFKEDIEHCLASGMDSHLGKPLDFKAVINILKKLG